MQVQLPRTGPIWVKTCRLGFHKVVTRYPTVFRTDYLLLAALQPSLHIILLKNLERAIPELLHRVAVRKFFVFCLLILGILLR